MNINIVGGEPGLVCRLMNAFRLSGHTVCIDGEYANCNTVDLTIIGCGNEHEDALRELVAQLSAARISGQEHSPITLRFDAGRYQITLPSVRNLLNLISLYLTQAIAACLADDAQGRFNTALNEALQNALIHGNLEITSRLRDEGQWDAYEALINQRLEQHEYVQRTIRIEALCDPQSVTVTVEDDGPGFDPAQLPDPREEDALLRASGRGISMIRFAMDEVHWNARGNRIAMTKHVGVA